MARANGRLSVISTRLPQALVSPSRISFTQGKYDNSISTQCFFFFLFKQSNSSWEYFKYFKSEHETREQCQQSQKRYRQTYLFKSSWQLAENCDSLFVLVSAWQLLVYKRGCTDISQMLNGSDLISTRAGQENEVGLTGEDFQGSVAEALRTRLSVIDHQVGINVVRSAIRSILPTMMLKEGRSLYTH